MSKQGRIYNGLLAIAFMTWSLTVILIMVVIQQGMANVERAGLVEQLFQITKADPTRAFGNKTTPEGHLYLAVEKMMPRGLNPRQYAPSGFAQNVGADAVKYPAKIDPLEPKTFLSWTEILLPHKLPGNAACYKSHQHCAMLNIPHKSKNVS